MAGIHYREQGFLRVSEVEFGYPCLTMDNFPLSLPPTNPAIHFFTVALLLKSDTDSRCYASLIQHRLLEKQTIKNPEINTTEEGCDWEHGTGCQVGLGGGWGRWLAPTCWLITTDGNSLSIYGPNMAVFVLLGGDSRGHPSQATFGVTTSEWIKPQHSEREERRDLALNVN